MLLRSIIHTFGLCALLAMTTHAAAAEWNHGPAYAGWRATLLLGTEVLGVDGEEMGEVEDLVVGADGRLRAVVVEASGMLGVGPARFVIPWSQVRVEDDTVVVPFGDDQIRTLAETSPAAAGGPGSWRVEGMLNRPVHLAGDRNFGEVDDLVFDHLGTLIALTVDPDEAGGGPYAWAWSDVTVDPAEGAVTLPATVRQLQALGEFDYGRMQGDALARR